MPCSGMEFVFADFLQRESERISKYRCFGQSDGRILTFNRTQAGGALFEDHRWSAYRRGELFDTEAVFHLVRDVPRKQINFVPV